MPIERHPNVLVPDSDNRVSRDLLRDILGASARSVSLEVRPHARAEVEAAHVGALRVAERQGVFDALDALFGDADE